MAAFCRKLLIKARGSLRKRRAICELRTLRERLRPYAKARGFLTDDDVFKSVS